MIQCLLSGQMRNIDVRLLFYILITNSKYNLKLDFSLVTENDNIPYNLLGFEDLRSHFHRKSNNSTHRYQECYIELIPTRTKMGEMGQSNFPLYCAGKGLTLSDPTYPFKDLTDRQHQQYPAVTGGRSGTARHHSQ